MPSKLSKVQKAVSKKKGSKASALHENSRDAKRLRRAGARDDRVLRNSNIREKANRTWLERVQFFQENLPETIHPLEVDTVRLLTETFLARNDDEIETYKAERRPGRPASTRQVLLEQARETEVKEYEAGFWMPNLTDEETLVKLDGWKGDWNGLANLRFVRLNKSGEVVESQFPPRGAS